MRILLAAIAVVSLMAGATWGAVPKEGDVGVELGSSDTRAVPPALRGGPQLEREPSPPPSGNPLWSIPLNSLRTTLDRPIFSPTRRPIVPPLNTPPPQVERPAAPVTPPELFNLVLIGTIAGSAETIAVFVDPATRSAIRLRVGEAYNGWVLREVRGRDASLEKGDRIEPVSMPRPDL